MWHMTQCVFSCCLSTMKNLKIKQNVQRSVVGAISKYLDSPSAHWRTISSHSSCLESLYLLSLYDELSAAVDGGVGELGLMTLGNQGSSELQMGRNRNRDPPSPNREEDPYLSSADPPQLREELPFINTARFIIKPIKNHQPTVDPYWS